MKIVLTEPDIAMREHETILGYAGRVLPMLNQLLEDRRQALVEWRSRHQQRSCHTCGNEPAPGFEICNSCNFGYSEWRPVSMRNGNGL